MEFPLPPFDEQSEIVRLIEGRLSASDRLSSTLDQQISRAQETRQSLLRQAFQGQLVQQDAEDEPASVLLDRVQVIRALAAAAHDTNAVDEARQRLGLYQAGKPYRDE